MVEMAGLGRLTCAEGRGQSVRGDGHPIPKSWKGRKACLRLPRHQERLLCCVARNRATTMALTSESM